MTRMEFTFPGTAMTVHRVGYGAMQLSGPGVFGPPRDREAALTVLREAVAAGVDHIDTSDFYGPHVTNRLIREALHPYAVDLVIATKVGCLRGADGSWPPSYARREMEQAIEDNRRNLGRDVLDVVNLRVRNDMGPLEPPFTVLAELQAKGSIRHLGLSGVTAGQIAEARRIAPVVCVQNSYNVAKRADDDLVDQLAADGIAFVPFFPLGGFDRLQSASLDAVAARLGAKPMQVALAWLLHRAPNVLLIPGTSSLAHLHENLAAGHLVLAPDDLAELDAIAAQGRPT